MTSKEAWLRRQAAELALQLGDNREDGHAILRYAREVFDGFLVPEAQPSVVVFPASRSRAS